LAYRREMLRHYRLFNVHLETKRANSNHLYWAYVHDSITPLLQ
jgi:hypothetical protein